MVGQCGACAVSTGYIAPKLQLRHAYVRTYRYIGLHWPERAARRCLLMRLLCSATQDQAAGGRCSSFVFATSPSTDQILQLPFNACHSPSSRNLRSVAREVLPSVEPSHDKMTEEGHDGTTSGVPTDRQGLKDLLREILTEEPSLLSTDDPAKTNPVGKLCTRPSCNVVCC